jgi:hypothetical protein
LVDGICEQIRFSVGKLTMKICVDVKKTAEQLQGLIDPASHGCDVVISHNGLNIARLETLSKSEKLTQKDTSYLLEAQT